jgi:hypothetical protein
MRKTKQNSGDINHTNLRLLCERLVQARLRERDSEASYRLQCDGLHSNTLPYAIADDNAIAAKLAYDRYSTALSVIGEFTDLGEIIAIMREAR